MRRADLDSDKDNITGTVVATNNNDTRFAGYHSDKFCHPIYDARKGYKTELLIVSKDWIDKQTWLAQAEVDEETLIFTRIFN